MMGPSPGQAAAPLLRRVGIAAAMTIATVVVAAEMGMVMTVTTVTTMTRMFTVANEKGAPWNMISSTHWVLLNLTGPSG